MSFTATTAIQRTPVTVAIDDSVSVKAGSMEWRLTPGLEPLSFNKGSGGIMHFGKQAPDGSFPVSVEFAGSRLASAPLPVSSEHVAGFGIALQALKNVSKHPRFPAEVEARLRPAFAALGQEGRSIG